MFEPRHNILSNVRTNVGKYVVMWLKHSRESNRRYPDDSLKSFVLVLISEVNFLQRCIKTEINTDDETDEILMMNECIFFRISVE